VSSDLTSAGGSPVARYTEAERVLHEAETRGLLRVSPATRRAYAADLRGFAIWCAAYGLEDLPASGQVVGLYLLDLFDRGLSPATILRHRAAIACAHTLLGYRPNPTQDPLVVQMSHVLREGSGARARASPLTSDALGQMLRASPSGSRAGARDRALLLLGSAGGLRPSELVGLDASDAEVISGHLVLTIPSARYADGRRGPFVFIPPGNRPETCPVMATRSWTESANIYLGPLFRPIDRHDNVGHIRLSPRAVASVIKRAAARAGLDPKHYSGRSLRSGIGYRFP
jgi:integrase